MNAGAPITRKPRNAAVRPVDPRPGTKAELLAELRRALGELFGAERRLRGREQQKPRELTTSQFQALIVLGKAQNVTAGELAKSADLNPASVTGMLDQLEANGIVRRKRYAHDRRVCMVSLTDRGRQILDERRAYWQARWEEHLGHHSKAELEMALSVMRTMAELLDGE